MSDWLSTWGTFVLTAVLVAVTAWYAYLTRSLAKSSLAAAESARIAAEASRTTVAASLAVIDVSFEVSPQYEILSASSEATFSGVDLHGKGATLFVHWCDLVEVSYPLEESGAFQSYRYESRLAPAEAGAPVRLHKGEKATFLIADGEARKDGAVAGLTVRVWYSVMENEKAQPYVVDWYGRPNLDY